MELQGLLAEAAHCTATLPWMCPNVILAKNPYAHPLPGGNIWEMEEEGREIETKTDAGA